MRLISDTTAPPAGNGLKEFDNRSIALDHRFKAQIQHHLGHTKLIFEASDGIFLDLHDHLSISPKGLIEVSEPKRRLSHV